MKLFDYLFICLLIIKLIKLVNFLFIKHEIKNNYNMWGFGDWGLGIGPNPQSPIPNPQFIKIYEILYFKF